MLPQFIDTLIEIKQLPRIEKFQILAQIEGVYIPSLYTPIYSSDGQLVAIKTIGSDIPTSITKQTWKGNTLSHSTVITPDAVWPNIHMVEVVRSCPELCRFCLASYLTLPFRSPSLQEGLIPAVEKGLTVTKRLGLLGASVTQHPEFLDLLNWLNHDRFEDLHLSVSSVRASTVSSIMAKMLARRGCKSLTIAIESGSEKIRNLVNKKLSEEEIINSAQYAKEAGLIGLKLYGMVGLPKEDLSDINQTADLLLRLKKRTSGLRITLGVSTFVPKAHTPFQWNGVCPESKKHLKLLAKKLKPNGIQVRPESYGWSIIQTLLSRSDRRVAPVIALVRGSQNSLGSWKKAYKAIQEADISNHANPLLSLPKPPHWEEVIHQNWDTSRVLPWEHLHGPLKKESLIKHHKDSLNQATEDTQKN